MELAKRLSSLRKASKSPLRAVAAKCNCSSQYLHKLENGYALRPALDILYRFAAFYQFSSDTLILEAEKIPQDVYWKIIHNPDLISYIREYKSISSK